jgi:endonuclease-3
VTPAATARTAGARAKRPRSKAEREALATDVYAELHRLYPDAHCELDYRNAFELLAATILSAQCTDKRVNIVTKDLFAAYPTAEALAAAPLADVERVVQSTGFFRAKAKNLVAMANALVERHGGAVPAEMDLLTPLPGVGRKTANVVLGNAFHLNVGVVVDTHVQRLATRFGLTRETDPVKIERDLMALFPQETWALLSHLLIWHGRRVCDAKKPRCSDCTLRDRCPSALV